jgi:sugar phosphate isomerase/epimerase
MGFKYAITLSSFRNIEAIEETLERLVYYGYDAVEMYGEPDKLDIRAIRDRLSSFNIAVCGITGMWGTSGNDEAGKRKLISCDQSILKYSKEYVKQCIKLCDELGGKELNLCLFADDHLQAFDRNHITLPDINKTRIIKNVLLPILDDLTRFAEDYSIMLLLEPLNRYSTPYCTTAKDAIDIAKQVNHSNFGILLDTFHMNIEEDSLENAILTSANLLRHTHFADNNRKMPGYAHIDFELVLKSLRHIEYNGFISFEPILNTYTLTSAKNGLNFIKSLVRNKQTGVGKLI